VAKGQGLADEDVAVAVVGVVVEVAAAEAGAVDCDLDFVFCWGGQVAGFLVESALCFSLVSCLACCIEPSRVEGCGVIGTHNTEVFCAVKHTGLDLCRRHD
jgi:hypothetical protein